MSSTNIRRWFDNLEEVLTAEARLAGLLGHGTMIGDAREFLVSRVLRSILPAAIHVGQGRVIDSEGSISNQIDVIIYDPRFPMLHTEGGGNLYFVEGVIGAVEVKSTLTHNTLIESLDNCYSVMSLSPHGGNIEEMHRFAAMLEREQNLTELQASQAAMEQMTPKTYIFAFDTRIGQKALTNAVAKWYHRNGQRVSQYQVRLPRVISTGNLVALANDVWLRLGWDDDTVNDLRATHGPDARIVMQVYGTHRSFGWLAGHVMAFAAGRLGRHDYHTGVSFSISEYQTAKLYFAELKRPHCIVWKGDRS